MAECRVRDGDRSEDSGCFQRHFPDSQPPVGQTLWAYPRKPPSSQGTPRVTCEGLHYHCLARDMALIHRVFLAAPRCPTPRSSRRHSASHDVPGPLRLLRGDPRGSRARRCRAVPAGGRAGPRIPSGSAADPNAGPSADPNADPNADLAADPNVDPNSDPAAHPATPAGSSTQGSGSAWGCSNIPPMAGLRTSPERERCLPARGRLRWEPATYLEGFLKFMRIHPQPCYIRERL